jgi:hypothetical protein
VAILDFLCPSFSQVVVVAVVVVVVLLFLFSGDEFQPAWNRYGEGISKAWCLLWANLSFVYQ